MQKSKTLPMHQNGINSQIILIKMSVNSEVESEPWKWNKGASPGTGSNSDLSNTPEATLIIVC
jgi:hypothetical protein